MIRELDSAFTSLIKDLDAIPSKHAPGKTLLVDVLEQSCGFGSFLGPNIFAKVAIDSIVPASRAIFIHVMSNPNCGFRSLAPGKPTE